MAAYEYLFALPPDATGRFAMAASTKGDDYVRTKDFVPNVDKYKTVGDKKGRTIPQGVDATELNVDIDPLLYANGEPISASTIRAALANDDYKTFRASYPMQSDEDVKKIWQILRGVQESLFSKEWWIRELSEDVDTVVEAVMNAAENNKHASKIKQLRSFLEKHRDASFVYDFNKFAKTVVGAKLIENILTENYITREELASIEHAVDGFFSEYGIDVDFQGKFTHFIDRLNDPRNEAPIYTDELKDFFEDLATEYGDKIARQLKLERPTGIGSDYQFDVPIHMPFMLQWNSNKNMIELIPRTIKKQRRPWQKNNPNDIIYKIESVMCEHVITEGQIITEGGAAGHMAHPWDDHGLTFNDMKEIVSRALEGRLDIESAVTEKTDGQNIQVTWKNGEIGFARNKGTVINPMTTSQIIADFERKYQESIAKNGAEASEGYKQVVEAYRACAEDLTKAFRMIPVDKLNAIFKNGRVFANMEIIYPATKNVIAYDKAHLQFHNLVEYDAQGNKIETDLSGGKLIQQIIQDANAHMQKTFSFIPPQQIKLGRISNYEDQQAAFFNEIDQLKTRYQLKDTDRVTEYHKAWWGEAIQNKAQQFNYDIPNEILNILIYRWAFGDKSISLTNLKKQIVNPEFLAWVLEFDKKDFKQYYKQNMEPFENIFLRLGAVVLKNAENFLSANPSKTVQTLKQELSELIKELQTTNNPALIQKLEQELRRIQKLGGFEAIVPSEGIVFVYGGHTYKLTGAFAPINQILGVLKYAR
jgi:gas vesicle protein